MTQKQMTQNQVTQHQLLQTQANGRARVVSPNRLLDLLFLNLMMLSVVSSLWVVYQDLWFLVVAVLSMLTADLTALLLSTIRANKFVQIAVVAVIYFLLSAFLAIPSIYQSPTESLPLLTRIVTAPVSMFKELLTLDLPLGTYQATLVPAVLLIFVTLVIALLTAWHSKGLWHAAIWLIVAVFIFSVALGTSSLSNWLYVGLYQIAGAVFLLFIIILMVNWRERATRNVNIRMLGSRKGYARKGLKRFGLAAIMLTVATLLALAVSPSINSAKTRDVLRTVTDPALTVSTQLGPLLGFRDYHSDAWFNETLFSYSPATTEGRLRLAVMPFYNGVEMSVLPSQKYRVDSGQSFKRKPAIISSPGLGFGEVFGSAANNSGETLSISYEAYSDKWVPLGGDLAAIEFFGDQKLALEDNFFVHDESGTGVQLATDPNSTVMLDQQFNIVTESEQQAVNYVPLNSGPRLPAEVVPRALIEWIDAQGFEDNSAAGFLQAVQTLKDRGYLSHSLIINENDPPTWVEDLGAYIFQPSRAGHFTARIGTMFADLLERQQEVEASSNRNSASLVATSGDDEQFAVAAYLLADHFGFEARVVLGLRLGEGVDASVDANLTHCTDGSCSGQDVAAWVEIKDSVTGKWAAVDVTPQHSEPPVARVSQTSDPKNPTEVVKETPELVTPPEPNPTTVEDPPTQENVPAREEAWLGALVKPAVISALILLLMISPFIAIAGAKVVRRSTRKSKGTAQRRAVLAWAELTDYLLDRHDIQTNKKLASFDSQTRLELASWLEPSVGNVVVTAAHEVDRAQFSGLETQDYEADAVWALVQDTTSVMKSNQNFWQRLRRAVSLKSLAKNFRNGSDVSGASANDAEQQLHLQTESNLKRTLATYFVVAGALTLALLGGLVFLLVT